MKQLYLIMAACKNWGIGFKGLIPWRIKEDMLYFKNTTKNVFCPDGSQNCVIMGSNTYASIGKPLSHRLNIVLSRNSYKQQVVDRNLVYFRESRDALDYINSCNDICNVYIIGGAQIYKHFMDQYGENIQCIFNTMIDYDYECDTFFNPIEYGYQVSHSNKHQFKCKNLNKLVNVEFQILTRVNK